MNETTSCPDAAVNETLTDAVRTARHQILSMFPDVLTVHFWIHQKTQRVRCEIALPKPGDGQHGKPSAQAITQIIDELIAPALPSQKKTFPPIVQFNIGVPTDISPVVSTIDKLSAGVGSFLKKLIPPSRSNGNNGSQN